MKDKEIKKGTGYLEELTRVQEKTLQSVSEQITDLQLDIEERQILSQSMEQSM